MSSSTLARTTPSSPVPVPVHLRICHRPSSYPSSRFTMSAFATVNTKTVVVVRA